MVKLLEHMNVLMGSANKLQANLHDATAEAHADAGMPRRGGKGKLCGATGKKKPEKMMGSKGGGSGGGRGGGSGGGNDKRQVITKMLQVVLAILRSSRTQGSSGNKNSSGSGSGSHGGGDDFESQNASSGGGIMCFFVARERPQTALFLHGASANPRQGPETSDVGAAVVQLCLRLGQLWTGIADEGALDAGHMDEAQQILRVVHELVFHTLLSQTPVAPAVRTAFHMVAKLIVTHVPCVLRDEDAIAQGSAKLIQARIHLEAVNRLLSDIALALPPSTVALSAGEGEGKDGDQWRMRAQEHVCLGLKSMTAHHISAIHAATDRLADGPTAAAAAAEGESASLTELSTGQQGLVELLRVTERALRAARGRRLSAELAEYVNGLVATLLDVLNIVRRLSGIRMDAHRMTSVWKEGTAALVSSTFALLVALCRLNSDPDPMTNQLAHVWSSVLPQALAAAALLCLENTDYLSPLVLLQAISAYMRRHHPLDWGEQDVDLLSAVARMCGDEGFWRGRCDNDARRLLLTVWSFAPAAFRKEQVKLEVWCRNTEATDGTSGGIYCRPVYADMLADLLYRQRHDSGAAEALRLVVKALDLTISYAIEAVASGKGGEGEAEAACMLAAAATRDNTNPLSPFVGIATRLLFEEAGSEKSDALAIAVDALCAHPLPVHNGSNASHSHVMLYWRAACAAAIGRSVIAPPSPLLRHELQAERLRQWVREGISPLLRLVDISAMCASWGRPGLAVLLTLPLAQGLDGVGKLSVSADGVHPSNVKLFEEEHGGLDVIARKL